MYYRSYITCMQTRAPNVNYNSEPRCCSFYSRRSFSLAKPRYIFATLSSTTARTIGDHQPDASPPTMPRRPWYLTTQPLITDHCSTATAGSLDLSLWRFSWFLVLARTLFTKCTHSPLLFGVYFSICWILLFLHSYNLVNPRPCSCILPTVYCIFCLLYAIYICIIYWRCALKFGFRDRNGGETSLLDLP